MFIFEKNMYIQEKNIIFAAVYLIIHQTTFFMNRLFTISIFLACTLCMNAQEKKTWDFLMM